MNIKPTKFPSQGQPNPRKIGVKVRIGFIYETDYKKTPTQRNSPQTPYCKVLTDNFVARRLKF